MPNGTPKPPKKYYSENTLQALANINAMKRQGASDDEIEQYLQSIGAERVNERTGFLGGVENLGRGYLQGMAEGVTSTVGAAGFLTRPIGGRALEDWAERTAAENAKFYDPTGAAGTTGRVIGRLGQEIAQAGLMAAPAAKLVGKVPGVGSALTRALESGSRLQRAGATAAVSAPIDVVQGIKSDTPFLLPESTGRLGSILEGTLTSGIAGGIMPAARIPESRRLGAGTAQQALPAPTQRLLPAPAPAAAPAEIVEEAVTAQPRTFYGEPSAPPSTVAPRTFYGQPSGPAALELPTAARAAEAPPPAAAAATVTGEAPNYPISYYSDWIFGSKKNPVSERIVLPEGTVRGIGMPGKDWEGGYDHFWLTVERQQGKRVVKSDISVRPVMTEQGLRLERVVADGPKSTGTGEFIDTPRPAPIPSEKQLARWRKQEERLDLKARGEEDVPTGGRPGFAQAQALTTLGGGGLGALAGGLTGTDRETSIAGMIGGGVVGAGLGAAVGRQLVRPGAPVPRGSTPDIQEINRTINVGERPRTTTDWLTGFQRFMTNWTAETRPMEIAARQAAGERGEQMLMERIAQAQGAGQAAKQYLIDNVQPALLAARGKFDDVRALLKARRDLNIRMRGGAEKSDVATDVLERAIRDAEADPAVKDAADAINGVYRDLLKRKYDAGMMTYATYKNILDSEDFFSPFVREFVEEANAAGTVGRGKKWAVSSAGIKRMDRTMQANAQTADPLEVLQSSVERAFKEIGRQNVQNVLASFADLDKIPNLIRRVDGEVTPGAATFTQMRSGRPVQYEVLEKDLFDAIAGQGPSSINNMFLLKMPAIALRAGVTLRPVFAITNAIRDVAMSGIQRPDVQRAIREMAAGGAVGGTYKAFTAEEGERMKGFLQGAGMGVGVGAYARPAWETMVAMRSVVGATLPPNAPDIVKRMTGDGEDYKQFLRLGGSTEGFYVRNATDAQEFLKRMERDGTIKDIINPGNVYRALTYVGTVSEQMTRLAAFNQLKKAGFTDAAAVLGAQDRTLRFAQRGKMGAKVADIAAFWNPRVQGMVKLGKLLKDPRTAGMAAAMITAPTLALWNVNKDNPEYWDTPVWERNLFWLVPKSGAPDEYGKVGFWRIPKPFEIGILFASLPERFLDAAAQSGVDVPLLQTGETAAPRVAEPGTAIKETVGTALGEATYGLLPIPTAVQVPLQLMTNRDIFRGRPIVSRTDLPAPQQATPESSAIARVLAERGISPQKTDFAIRGTFGGLGTDVSNVIDAAVRAAGGAAPEPRAPRTGISAIIPRQLQTRTYSSTEAETSARDRLRRLEGIHRGMLKEEASNDPNRIVAYEEKHRRDLDSWAMLNTYKTELDNIAAERRAIIADQRIPQAERRKILAALRKEADAAAREVLAFGAPQ